MDLSIPILSPLSGEDEWSSVKRRFSSEGLSWSEVDAAGRVLHVWRWLVDADANLKTARHINDKLMLQHQQENKVIYGYCGSGNSV